MRAPAFLPDPRPSGSEPAHFAGPTAGTDMEQEDPLRVFDTYGRSILLYDRRLAQEITDLLPTERDIVQDAKKFVPEAVTFVLRHFEGHLVNRCLTTYIDEDDKQHPVVDDELYYKAQLAVFAAITRNIPKN